MSTGGADRPRVGLAGCGLWGRRVLASLLDAGADVQVADPSHAARLLAEAEGARAVGSVDELDPCDGLVVATPASTHAAVLDQLVERPEPVLCEKPLTTDGESARRLAGRFGSRLSVGHVWRHHPGIELLGQLARSGAVGQVHGVRSTRVGWTSPRTDVDSVWTLVPHDLTIALEVLGHLPAPRAALAERLGPGAVSLWALCGGPAGGQDGEGDEPWLVVEASTRFAGKRREVRVHGSEAVAVLPDDEGSPVRIERVQGDLGVSIQERPFPPERALDRMVAGWLGHLAGGPPPKSDGAEGAAVVEGIEALRRLAGLEAGP